MKKIYILEDLDCANCASKIEADTKELEGVNSASLAFMTQKLTLDVEAEKAEEIDKKLKKIVKKYEPDVTVRASK